MDGFFLISWKKDNVFNNVGLSCILINRECKTLYVYNSKTIHLSHFLVHNPYTAGNLLSELTVPLSEVFKVMHCEWSVVIPSHR